MISIDTNILLYAFCKESGKHQKAKAYLESLIDNEDVILSEFILIEFYTLLRNQAVL